MALTVLSEEITAQTCKSAFSGFRTTHILLLRVNPPHEQVQRNDDLIGLTTPVRTPLRRDKRGDSPRFHEEMKTLVAGDE